MSEPPRRCVVLGGSGALGRVVCASLAAEGARVAFTYHRDEAAAADLAPAFAERLDLARTADIPRVMDSLTAKLGGIDALVHCATLTSTAPAPRFDTLDDLDEEGFDRLMAVNVKSAVFAARHFTRIADRARATNIVLLGSIDGTKPIPAPLAYATSKAALSGLAQSLAKEVGKQRVCVNVVAPGVLESGASRLLPDELRKEYLKHCGLKRPGRLQEAADLVVWLALENTYVTGRTILVDGGL